MVRTLFVLVLAVFTYFVSSLLYAIDPNFSTQVYNVALATATVIWCISMLILFVDLPVFLIRFKAFLGVKPVMLIVPSWVLYMCCVVGSVASLLGIWTTCRYSWAPEVLSDSQWFQIVGISVVIFLAIGLVGFAYPSLVSNLNEQTETARENTRLYQEQTEGHERLLQLDRLKDAFLITASHELRTPLTIISGYLELLKEMNDARQK